MTIVLRKFTILTLINLFAPFCTIVQLTVYSSKAFVLTISCTQANLIVIAIIYLLFHSLHLYIGKSRLNVLEYVIQLYKIDLHGNESDRPCDLPSSSSSASPPSSLVSTLLQKHIQGDQNASTLSEELYRFQNITSTDDNILFFWKKNAMNFPKLAAIAKVVLSIPMTTSKSESSFSTTGYLLRKQCASITPFRAEKILFIHDNYDILKM